MLTHAAIPFRTYPAPIPGEPGAVIRHGDDGPEMVNLRWGLSPVGPGGDPRTAVRSEGRTFPQDRCLVPASEFFYRKGGKRFQFTLANGDWFYLAGVWQPAAAGWPDAYAVLTIEPNPDIEPYHHRQMAVILREDRMTWLNGPEPESILRPLPAHTFAVAPVKGAAGIVRH